MLSFMLNHTLVAWIGNTDLRAVLEVAEVGQGPVAQALATGRFDRALLLCNYPRARSRDYLAWLESRVSIDLELQHIELSGPTEFAEIYPAVVKAVEQELARSTPGPSLTFHLSPGTPAMAAIWIILAKTRFPAELVESTREHGLRVASVPFDMSADFLPDLLRKPDERLERLSVGLPPEAPEFADIVHRSTIMRRLVAMARMVAVRSVPVLIEGESGTGKELFARAIHRSSPRREKPFVAVNCGAIPTDLVESTLFGHEKGAFTGAHAVREGVFEAASGGTLFLDELGELPLAAQVKLLRVLQESEVTRVGATAARRVDVRVIAATNRDLIAEVRAGRFREDLFYRLAVAVLRLPPLNARPTDITLLAERFMHLINEESKDEPTFRPKRLAPGARQRLTAHRWPGNVRELYSTLRRAAIWTTGEVIREDDLREAMLESIPSDATEVLGRPLGDGLDLQAVLSEVARHYLERALAQAKGNKSEAARLVGLPSYQTFTNWVERYGVKESGKGEM